MRLFSDWLSISPYGQFPVDATKYSDRYASSNHGQRQNLLHRNALTDITRADAPEITARDPTRHRLSTGHFVAAGRLLTSTSSKNVITRKCSEYTQSK